MRALAPSVWHHRAIETTTPSRRTSTTTAAAGRWPWPGREPATARRIMSALPGYRAHAPLRAVQSRWQWRRCDCWSRGPAAADPHPPVRWGLRRHAGSPVSRRSPGGRYGRPGSRGARYPCNPMYKYSEAGRGALAPRVLSLDFGGRGSDGGERIRGPVRHLPGALAALPAFPSSSLASSPLLRC